MLDLSVTRCVALTQALNGEDPEQCLQHALTLLAADGVIAHAREHGPPWLVIEHAERRLALSAQNPLTPASRALLENLLGLALRRSEESRAYRQVSERMNMLSAASFEGIMVHVNGVIIDANQRLAEILGCEAHETLGDWPLRHCVAPEDLPSVLERMASGFEGAYVITGVRKNGTRFRAELQSKQSKLGERPVRIAAVRDVTEREDTLALLRESETRLRDLADTVFDLTVLSRDGIVVDARGATEKILGYTREQMIGRSLLEFVAPSSLPLATQVLSERRAGAYYSTVRSATDELIPVEIIAVNSTFDGKPTRVAGLRDLRETVRRDQDRRKLEQQVERSQRLDGLGVLAGGIAHDFNNLLMGVLGNAHLLLSSVREPDARESLQAIITAGERAASLTAQMLTYAGRGEAIAPRPVELDTLIRELKVLLSASLSKKAELVMNLAPGCVVLADPTTLTQVLMNLLANASDALAGQPGRIEIRTTHLTEPDSRWDDSLGATVGPGNWVLLEIEDSGVGMDEATLARAFEPFFTTKEHGHGLGLAACLGIVSSHGGALRVESTLGRGSCFSLLLPVTHITPRKTNSGVQSARQPCRVLVIDDEPLVRSQLRRFLELRGYSVAEAGDGISGLALFERDGADLIVLDLTMPKLDGADVISELRRRGSTVPIVLSSGYLDPAVERRLEPGSFQAFLQKPYGVSELLEALDRAYSTGGSASGRGASI